MVSRLTVRASGSAAASTAWERYARPAEWAGWSPQIRRVDSSAERIRPGVTGRVHGPLGVSVSFVVDEVDEPARRWSWTVRRWPVTLHLQHGVLVAGDGCSTWLTIEGPLPVIAAYAPLAHLALRRLVAR